MKTATLKQSAKILSLFEDTPLEQVQDLLESGFLADLRDANVARINRDEFRRVVGLKLLVVDTVIQIDRTQSFNPTEFIGEGWSIEEEDKRSLTLTEVDLDKVFFETTLNSGESYIKGEEKLRRLKETNHIRLDAKIFQTLWEGQHLIPESWKKKTGGYTTYVFFDGTVLHGPDGNRGVLYLYWHDGKWHWNYLWLGHGWDARNPSAVLASP